jgi:hypothetical protein
MSNPKLKTAKKLVSIPAIQHVIAGRYARLRIPRTAVRHTESQLAKFVRVRKYFPPIVLDDKGAVLAGFAQAQLSNRYILGRYVPTVKFSELTGRYIRGYIQWLKKAARRDKWDTLMLAVELQFLRKPR